MKPSSYSNGTHSASVPTSLGRTYAYPRGVELFRQGDRLQEVLEVVSGIVKLTQCDASGKQSITGLAAEGDWLGTASVVAARPSPNSAVTCCDALLRRVSSASFKALLRRDPQLSLRIHQAHSRELCRQTTWLGQMCSLSSLQRLQCILCRIAAIQSVRAGGSTVRLQLPLHHWELAEFIGIRPEYLSRLMKEMEARNLIRRDKGWIVILDPKRLCDNAGL